MELRALPYDHPDATGLIDQLQQEYVLRYGDVDHTPVDPAEFAPPTGNFLIGYVNQAAVACGGWRAAVDPELSVGDAEIKRMYVTAAMRGRGLSRPILAELERLAAENGYHRLVLETGQNQPEALALYSSAGYHRIPGFGLHRDEPLSVCMAKVLRDGVAGPIEHPVSTKRQPNRQGLSGQQLASRNADDDRTV